MYQPSVAEVLVLLVLLVSSGFLFWRRFGTVLRIILASKKDADFRLRPVGPRLRQFALEVLAQTKVIRERPLAGLAHALVFWGFCAFALVTLNHLAQGFGFALLHAREGAFGRSYSLLSAMFAAAVAVSIAGLAARRFLVRPKWLGSLSPESGLVALLIFTLMATYLMEYFLQAEGAAGRILWWIHTAALLMFLPLIPHSKHIHLLLSPVAVFLSRGGFSRIPPLAGDDDFGLVAGKDVTRLAALQAFSCVECGRCAEHCPAYNTNKELNPKQVVLGTRGYLNGPGPGSEEPLLGGHISMESVFQCTTCGACEYQCPVGIEHLPLLIGLRRGAVNTGAWEDEHGTKLFLNLERSGNPLGFSTAEREKFIEKSGLPRYDGSQEYCLWLGCMGAYDQRGREIATALAKVLRHLGISYGVLKKERCTGDAARRLGNDLLFQTLAEQNIDEIGRSGVKKLLSICPHCVRTLGEDYREFGAEITIEHHSELLARLLGRLPGKQGSERVVFHDPCYLGRYRGVYEEPRQVAALAGLAAEAPRSRERSFCCGAGGGLVFLGEEKGTRVSVERTRELVATGADVIAAACPFCNTMFADALATRGAAGPRLLDIAQIAAGVLH
jgi:Fe-S oxidoreductase